MRVRRSLNARPVTVLRSRAPCSCTRSITIQASPPSSNPETSDDRRDTPNFEIVDDAPATSGSSFASSSSSQHPFSAIETEANPHPPNEGDGAGPSFLPARIPGSPSTLPQPPELSEVQWNRVQHPFDTHAFVNYLEKAGLNSGTSTTLMEAVRRIIVLRTDRTRDIMMAKEDMENVRDLVFDPFVGPVSELTHGRRRISSERHCRNCGRS